MTRETVIPLCFSYYSDLIHLVKNQKHSKWRNRKTGECGFHFATNISSHPKMLDFDDTRNLIRKFIQCVMISRFLALRPVQSDNINGNQNTDGEDASLH